MKKILFLIISILFNVYSYGAYLTNVPITLTQPDGTVINCFATGDEFYNWVHDSLGYTIVQSPTTGYYHYAILDNDSLICSIYIVGTVLPQSVGLQPNINISSEKIIEIINIINQVGLPKQKQKANITPSPIPSGTVNNIIIYIKFADQTQGFSNPQYYYTQLFNTFPPESGVASLRNYFRVVTYNKVDVVSHFFPKNSNIYEVLCYEDQYNGNYYRPQVGNNSIGYNDYYEGFARLNTLLINAINAIKNDIPAGLDLDCNNDTYVDNICFIIKGMPDFGNSNPPKILWPKRSSLISSNITINNKTVNYYNLQFEDWMGVSTLCHEMGHTFTLPDLYHYNETPRFKPVGGWDLMGDDPSRQHMGAYMKYKYGKWIDNIPTITTFGTYTLYPITYPTNNCYQIPTSNPNQFIVLEYRRKTGIFESSIPGSGLLIYRINNNYSGNDSGQGAGGKKDEVYIYRPGGTLQNDGDVSIANFSNNVNRTEFGNSTDPYCFLVDGSYGNIFINNIRENSNGTLSFDVIRPCDGTNITYSNTSNIPVITNASNSIQTSGTVVVKSTDNVTFEAGSKVTLNPGFKVELGGKLKIDIKECGE